MSRRNYLKHDPAPFSLSWSTTASRYPPPPCPSTPKVRKTTVRRAHVLRQARTCTRRSALKERMSKKTCMYLTLTTIVATGHYSTVCRQIAACSGGPLLPVKGISSCGIEALSNLVTHLESFHMLALWGRLWSRLGFRFWNGFRLPISWDKTVINNIFGEAKRALKDMAKAPNRTARFGPHNLHFIILP